MYPVSNAFHTAVRNGADQMALLIFKEIVFTNSDINIDRGLKFCDYFNLEKDLAIGQVNSNEIEFGLFNDARYLNSYAFGDFLATIGVKLGEKYVTLKGNVMVTTNLGQWVGSNSAPYLTKDGVAVAVQPTFAPKSLLSYDGKVYVFGSSGKYKVYSDADGSDITSANKLNSFMRYKKAPELEGKGVFYNKSTRILFIYEGETQTRYEFCPLGWFTAERPNAPDQIEVEMRCLDWMQKFDKDMPAASKMGVTYPTTIGNLFSKLCTYIGVTPKAKTFINSTVTIPEEPEEFKDATCRRVLGWIAEAAGSNARFDRDGKVVLDWVRTTTQSYDENWYQSFEPYWYETKKVNKLYNRTTHDASEKTLGSGENGYLIQDNPLLKGVS